MSKRGITIVAVLILVALALATWGGTKLGNDTSDNLSVNMQEKPVSAAEQTALEQENEILNNRLSSTMAELTQIQSDYTALQQESEILNNRLSSTMTELTQIQSQYDALKQDNAELEADLAAKNAALADSQAAYTTLQRSNTRLQAQLTSTTEDLTDMQLKYQDLLQDYDNLQVQLTSAQADVSNLTASYAALQGTKKWVVDNRIQVSLSTETEEGQTTWVRGDVTNISSVTIPKIYVLVSRYNSSGTLVSMDLPPSVILNLAPGGVGYFSFFSTSELCKITVISDY
jgi:predicted  nucleic acid-binding Zn-ribbon protein